MVKSFDAGAGSPMTIRSPVPPEKKIAKTIGWYNRSGNLQQPIIFSKVGPLLAQLEPAKAGMILAQLDSKAAEIKDPTGWLSSAARKAGASDYGMGGMGGMGSMGGMSGSWGGMGGMGGMGSMSAEVDPSIRKTIGWMNKQGNLQDQIMFKDVGPLLGQLGASRAGQLLNQLGEKAAEVKNPTSWLANAARKAGAGSGGGFGGGGGGGGFGGYMPEGGMAWGGDGGGAFGGYMPEGGMGGMGGMAWGGDESQKKISKTIGWLNKQGILQDQIMFKDVAPLLSQIDPSMGCKILKQLEGKAAEIKNPTAWIANAARKAGAM